MSSAHRRFSALPGLDLLVCSKGKHISVYSLPDMKLVSSTPLALPSEIYHLATAAAPPPMTAAGGGTSSPREGGGSAMAAAVASGEVLVGTKTHLYLVRVTADGAGASIVRDLDLGRVQAMASLPADLVGYQGFANTVAFMYEMATARREGGR